MIAISFVLVLRDPWFAFYGYTGYAYSALLLPWPWLLAGLVPTAVVSATGQTHGVLRATPLGVTVYLAVIVANIVVTGGVALIVHRVTRQNERSAQMLDEVQEANRRLEVALEENAGLQRQLLTQAREAGVLDERQRLAREIHDTLAQGLTGIITQLQATEDAADEPAQWRGHHDAAISLARESLSEARRSVDALRPEPLETAPLSQALAGVAARWSALHSVPAWVTTTGTARPLAAHTEDALLRTAQEALANVAKHAQATRVGVTLSYLQDEVALDLLDDGRGFVPASSPPRPDNPSASRRRAAARTLAFSRARAMNTTPDGALDAAVLDEQNLATCHTVMSSAQCYASRIAMKHHRPHQNSSDICFCRSQRLTGPARLMTGLAEAAAPRVPQARSCKAAINSVRVHLLTW